MFSDTATILVRSGKGGNGAVHFRREKYVPHGGPDGGDGGRGGDVYIQVDSKLNTLNTFQHRSHFFANDGKPGAKQKMSGRGADDLVIPVPPGTLVFDKGSDEILGDLTQAGDRLLVCKGGRGGRGNTHFKSSTNQAPRAAEKGEPGEEKQLRLELKLIAYIGIVGVPNAGKSTLLTALTHARPKIAAYPFTTLEPYLGVAQVDSERSVVLADIPGLIEGASQGAGLGFEFLRHIQRTRVLIHLLDGQSADPLADYNQINAELVLFDAALGKKPQVVALNKLDVPEVKVKYPKIKKEFKKLGVSLEGVSAMEHSEVHKLLQSAVALLSTVKEPEVTGAMPVYRAPEDPRDFKILHQGGSSWRIVGAGIERAAAMTYWEHDGAVRRFQKIMEKLGVDAALSKAGAREGDTVFIGEYELEYSE